MSTCLTARQGLSRQRVDWLVWTIQIHTRQQCWARPGEHTSAGLCIGAAGAAGERAGYNNDCTGGGPRDRRSYKLQSGGFRSGDVVRGRRRWRTGAGGVTSNTAAAPVEDWRRRAAAPVEDWSRRTLREPAAGVMDRWSGQSSDSESRSLHTAGLGQPAGQHRSAGPTCLHASPGKARADIIECQVIRVSDTAGTPSPPGLGSQGVTWQ